MAANVVTPRNTVPRGAINRPRLDVSEIWLTPLHKITTTEATAPAPPPLYRRHLGHVPDCPHRVRTAVSPPLPRLRSPKASSIAKARPARLVPSESGREYVLLATRVASTEQSDAPTVPAANWRGVGTRRITIVRQAGDCKISGRRDNRQVRQLIYLVVDRSIRTSHSRSSLPVRFHCIRALSAARLRRTTQMSSVPACKTQRFYSAVDHRWFHTGLEESAGQ